MDGQRAAKISAITIFMIAGTFTTFGTKLLGSQYVDEGGIHRKFFHPYIQTLTVFMGQSICLILYYSNRKKNELPLQVGKKPHKFYYFLIPALTDTCSSILQFMAMNFISGSTFLMFKGAVIVTTAVFSKFLFGMVIQKRHYVGCGMAIIGLVVVGSSGFLQQKSSSDDFSKQLLGYTVMLISLIFNGFLYAYQQYLMRKHTINPMYLVGWQGFFGIFIILIVSLILSITPCSLQQELCVYDSYGNPYFERVDQFFRQIFTDYILTILVIVSICAFSAYSLNGARITKLIDALSRSLLNITKTVAVWIIGIVITFSVGDNPDYQLESKQGLVNVVKGIGFLLIVFGTLIYNKLILNKYLSENEEKEQQNTRSEQNENLLNGKDQKIQTVE